MGTQQIVGLGGAGLIAVNFWTGSQRKAVADGLFQKGSDTSKSHADLTQLGAEILFVVVATVLAGVSDSWANAMALVIVGLFIVWALNKYGAGNKQSGSNVAA